MRNKIAENLIKLQQRSGKSKKDFAMCYGIKDSTFSSYIAGRAIPPVDLLIDICDGEGVELDWLCGRKRENALISVSQVGLIIGKLLFNCPYDCENMKIDLKKGNDNSVSEVNLVIPSGTTVGNDKLLEMVKRMSELNDASANINKEQFNLIMDSITNDYSMEFLH